MLSILYNAQLHKYKTHEMTPSPRLLSVFRRITRAWNLKGL